MANFDSGIKRYIKATASITMFFPVDAKDNELICCDMCRFYRLTARRCGITDEIIPYASKYVGDLCPLERVEDGD